MVTKHMETEKVVMRSFVFAISLAGLGAGAAGYLTSEWGNSGSAEEDFILGMLWTCAALCLTCLVLGELSYIQPEIGMIHDKGRGERMS